MREAAYSPDLTGAANVQDLHDRCRRRLRDGTGRLLVDLTLVTTVDTKLVASLVLIKREAQANGRPVEIRCSPQVTDWLRMYRLDALIEPTVPLTQAPPGPGAQTHPPAFVVIPPRESTKSQPVVH